MACRVENARIVWDICSYATCAIVSPSQTLFSYWPQPMTIFSYLCFHFEWIEKYIALTCAFIVRHIAGLHYCISSPWIGGKKYMTYLGSLHHLSYNRLHEGIGIIAISKFQNNCKLTSACRPDGVRMAQTISQRKIFMHLQHGRIRLLLLGECYLMNNEQSTKTIDS